MELYTSRSCGRAFGIFQRLGAYKLNKNIIIHDMIWGLFVIKYSNQHWYMDTIMWVIYPLQKILIDKPCLAFDMMFKSSN